MISKILYLFLVVIIFSIKSIAQQLNFAHYSTSDGLSNSCVYGLHQDKQGFLWIATEFGLNKFDGNTFKSFDASTNFPENTTLAVTDGFNNDMLVSSLSKGIISLSKNGKVKKVLDPLKGRQATKIFRSQTDLYFFGLPDLKAGIYNSITKKTSFFSAINNQKSVVTSVCLFKNKLLIAEKNGLYLFSEKTTTLLTKHFINNDISAMCLDKEGNIWLGTKGVIYKIDQFSFNVTDSIVFDSNKINKVDCIVADSKNKLWFSTMLPIGLFCATKVNKKYNIDNIGEKLNLGYCDINDLVLDNEHNLWIATYNKGVYCIKNTFLYADANHKQSYINSIFVDSKSNIYLGSIEGVYVIDQLNKKEYGIRADINAREYIYGFQEFDDEIFVRTNGIYKTNKNYYKTTNTLFTIQARSVFFMNDTLTLIGGWKNEIDVCKYKNKKFTAITTIKLDKNDSITNRVNKITIDNDGVIWCGADLGLYKINLNKKEAFKVVNEYLLTRVTDILSIEKNNLWCATENSLVKYNGIKWDAFTQIDGHKLGKVNALAADAKKRLYVGTYKGLFILENRFTTFLDDKSGLSSNEINSIAYDKAQNIMAIATNEGFAKLNIDEYDNFKKQALSVIIKSFSVKDSILPDSKKYILNHAQNNISLNYVAINLTYPKSVIYQYKIDENTWIKTISNTLELATLSYGDHIVKIRASLDNKRWSQPALVEITVLTPFYATFLFWIFIFICIALVLFFLIQYRIKRIRTKASEKNVLQQQLEELKFRSLNASINPHFIFNSLNSIQNYINHNDKAKASNYLGKFARLIRLVLDKANEKEITIKEEIDRLKYYLQLEQDRFNHNFTYEIIVSSNILEIFIPNMIVQPLVENAILHGVKDLAKGFITISFYVEEQNLIIEVKDDGVGIEGLNQSSIPEHKSMALVNIKDRLSMYEGATINITSKKGFQGTLVKILLPLKTLNKHQFSK